MSETLSKADFQKLVGVNKRGRYDWQEILDGEPHFYPDVPGSDGKLQPYFGKGFSNQAKVKAMLAGLNIEIRRGKNKSGKAGTAILATKRATAGNGDGE